MTEAIEALVHAKWMNLVCENVLNKSRLISFLMHGSEIMAWREREKS